MIRSAICGIGMALPKRVVKNADLEEIVDTSDEWIHQRTGIRQRYIAGEGETTVTLGTQAAQAALEDARLGIQDIDMIILATSTPDHTFPASATEIQRALGMAHGFAFDIQAVCSGFIFAMTTADLYIRCKTARRALVIGSETFSRLLDWKDRTTCVLFGDGAGAVILEAREGKGDSQDYGILASILRSDGRHIEKLYVDGGPSTTQTTGHLCMEGREVFKYAVGMISDVVDACLEIVGITAPNIDWFIPHQANRRIIESLTHRLGISDDKVVITVDKHGNTSAASVPLALAVADKDGRLRKGDLIMLQAMGGGFAWGSIILRL
ncbi:MAG: 3-oxoacyl-[acyl-carrier-protein] synthase III [Candidatus Tokpelaia sp. JSC161]|jgi:3-oxoacyl-[acyl-carrier-protein] synthase-3|nr:MAG: 3-oxoacyl-[acyl-carrier-protein] synthase III [Candidatus Tokpelaia sp. JSC161]